MRDSISVTACDLAAKSKRVPQLGNPIQDGVDAILNFLFHGLLPPLG
jgi:hypothetical protein